MDRHRFKEPSVSRRPLAPYQATPPSAAPMAQSKTASREGGRQSLQNKGNMVGATGIEPVTPTMST